MRLHLVLWQICEAQPRQGRIQSQRKGVEHQLPFDPDLQLAPVLLELPGIDPPVSWQAQIDAVVRRQLLRRPRARIRAK